MDRISHLPEHLLLTILSFLPTTKDVVATMVLSKRWQFLWMLMPLLVYDDGNWNGREGSFSRFVYRSLLLHEAPVLESLVFKLGSVVDIGVWARTVARRDVRELVIKIDRSSCTDSAILPKSLYTVSRMLVKLKLNKVVLVDFSSPVSFPSLKKLSLVSIQYPQGGGDEFVSRLLSNCPVLENLCVKRCPDDNVAIFTVRVPSLKILRMYNLTERHSDDANWAVIDAPSLETLSLDDLTGGFCVLENKMLTIVEADIDFTYSQSGKILGSITPVKELCLCLSPSNDSYPSDDSLFHRLVKITLCRCLTQWLNLLMCVLRGSPNLRCLLLDQHHGSQANQPSPCWSEPSIVPECLLSSLETLGWASYEGTLEEKEVVEFILRNGRCLKKVSIFSKSTDSDEKLEMIKDLALSSRRSPLCQLVFN